MTLRDIKRSIYNRGGTLAQPVPRQLHNKTTSNAAACLFWTHYLISTQHDITDQHSHRKRRVRIRGQFLRRELYIERGESYACVSVRAYSNNSLALCKCSAHTLEQSGGIIMRGRTNCGTLILSECSSYHFFSSFNIHN